MGSVTIEKGSLAHEAHRTALVVRYFHGFASLALVAVGALLFFRAEGHARRLLWEELALLLGANGAVSVVGMPILLAITARWRRPGLRPIRRLTLDADADALLIRTEDRQAFDVPRSRIASAYAEPMRDGTCRLTLTLEGGPPADRFVLMLDPRDADDVTAFIGARRRSFDGGARDVRSAGWTFSAACAASSILAVVLHGLLRAHVPREVFEPASVTQSAGWALGMGVAFFAPFHALLAYLTRMPRLDLGVDGFSVARFGRVRTWAWSSLAAATRSGSTLELTRADGVRERVRLGPLAPPRMDALLRVIRANVAAAHDEPPVESERDDRSADVYRVAGVDGETLASRLLAPGASHERRIRVARRLATEGARGHEAIRGAAATAIDPALRDALVEIAAVAEAAATDEAEAREAGHARPLPFGHQLSASPPRRP